MKNNITIFIIFIFSLNSFSQDPYDIVKDISNSKISENEKQQKFDSILNTHKKNKNLDQLLKYRFEILKWHKRRRRLTKAIELNKRNIYQMDSVNYQDRYAYRKNLYSLGFYERKNHDLEDAINTLKRLLKYKEPDKFAYLAAFQIAEIYFFSYDQYHTSKEYFTLSKTIAERLNNNTFIVKNAIGIAQSCKLINTRKSLKSGIKVLSNTIEFTNAINCDDDGNNNIHKKHIHGLYNQLGNMYIDRTDYDFDNGKLNLDKALLIAEELNEDKKLFNKEQYIYSTYNDIGVLYLKDEREEAEFYFKKALTYEPNRLMKSVIYRNLSNHHLFFKDYDKALRDIQTALVTLIDLDTSDTRNLPSKVDLSNSSVKLQLISNLIDKALIWTKLAEEIPENKSYIDEAIKTFELADFLTEKARIDSKEFKSKLFWRKTATDIYVGATKASFLSNDPEKAFYFIEKNKALLLLEDVSLKMSRNNTKIPESIVKQESQLRTDIAELEERIIMSKNKDVIQSQLLLANDDYDQFINSLAPNYQFYYKTQKPAEIINFKSFKSTLLDNTNAYIEYILGDKEGFGILITKDETQLFEIKDLDRLKQNARIYRQLIEQPFLDKTSTSQFNTVSNALYEALFPDQIKSLIKNKKLTILADYYLQNIPFESLQTSKEDRSYLIFQNEISYAYSLSFLSENNKIERSNRTNLIGFAPVEFSDKLTSLPNTEEELNLIDKLFPSKVYLNEGATKERFFSDGKNAKIIHIASHADANDSISPWIAFRNSRVDLKGLYNFNNTADLVVLSACNTSLGELNKGEGVMSLSRSFFNTGSHSVLPTLWEVNDKTTVKLLESFYKNIQLGQNKSLALHNAKLDYLKTSTSNQSLPYYWASFILIGDSGAIDINNGIPSIYYYISIAILLLIIGLIIQRKKIKN
ncbi:CHAT domain-containing tetratricopeptide repeat protein [uncultured Psychroserpens sp.]|uniref:CHAT domain-containing protein n=1 Tax=uncultured Psychroserpens sp. TaxID=255436 RepID=UPI00262239E1|nr:CHAT domain-containing tetratricopeptide repeat protein [uncultured Psychroserpens sp.]